jgi:hypothetical protein
VVGVRMWHVTGITLVVCFSFPLFLWGEERIEVYSDCSNRDCMN